MLIQVTQNQINCGVPSSTSRCPLAMALNKVMKDGYFAAVCADFVVLADPPRTVTLPLPEVARNFVIMFDRTRRIPKRELELMGLYPQPFEFDLDIPPEFLK